MSEPAPVSDVVQNERTKLTATWLNTLASGFILVGLVTPLATILYGLNQARTSPWLSLMYNVIFVGIGVGLHLRARTILGGLRP